MGLIDEVNERKKKKREDEEKSSWLSLSEEVKLRRTVNEDYINSFVSDYDRFMGTVNDGSASYDRALNSVQVLGSKADTISSWLKMNKGRLEQKTYNDLYNTISQMQSGIGSVKDYYSQWDSEDAYNTYITNQKAYNEKINYDLSADQKELDELLAVKAEYDSLKKTLKTLAPSQADAENKRMAEIYQQYGDLDAKISEKRAFINEISRLQEGVKLASVADPTSANYDPDFDKYSGYTGSTWVDNWWDRLWSLDSTAGMKTGYEDIRYDYINDPDAITDYLSRGSNADLQLLSGLHAYSYMTKDQVAIYNYYYATGGKEVADKYLDSIQDSLNSQQGKQLFSSVEGNPLLEYAFGIGAGLDQFASGLKSLLSDKDYIPTTSMQYASGLVREDLKDIDLKWYNFKDGEMEDAKIFGNSLGQGIYDFITTSANMAPSILASSAIGMLNPVAGQVAGSALLGASAAGNAYQEKLNLGYTKEEAMGYGLLVGTSEAVLEKVLGGISKLGGGTLSKVALNNLDKVDNVLARFAKSAGGKLLMNAGSEAIEEGLQSILEPYLWQAVSGEEASVDWEEALYSALLGFATGGAFESIENIGTAIDKSSLNPANKNALKYYGEVTGDLIKEGLQSDPSSKSYQLAKEFQEQTQGKDGKDGKAMSGYQIRQLVEANDAQFAVEDYNAAVSSAKERLTELGETKNVDKISELVAKRATGQELSRSERKTLVNSQYGSKVAREMRTDAEQTVAYKPITERVGTEGRYGVSETGKTTVRGEEQASKIAEVVTVKEGQMTVKMEDGREVDAGEIDFADDGEALLYSAIADMENMTPAAATALVKAYDPASKQATSAYVNGIDEAYSYGYYGYSVNDLKAGEYAPSLSSKQMMSAYNLGQSARKIGVKSDEARRVKMRTAAEAKVSKKEKAAKQKARFESDAEVYFMDGKNTVKFDEHTGEYDEKRMAGVNTAKFLSKMGIGGKFVFFESYVNEDGKRVYKDASGAEKSAPNGIFTASDGTVYIDLNAGDKGQGTTLFTMGHELTHFVKAYSEKQFQVLADLVTEAFGKTNLSMHERVVAKQDQLSKLRDEHVTYAEAFEEVVADAMSTMLSDGSFHEKLMEIKAKDKGLFNTIKRFFENLIAKFRKIYKDLDPDQREARDIRDMKDMLDKIQDAFAEALVEASENFHAAMESVVAKNAKPVGADETLTEGAVVTDGEGTRFSIRSMEHDITDGQMFRDLMNVCGWTKEQVGTLRNQLKDLVQYMIPYRDILDMNESYGAEGRRFSPYKPNSDPLYKISMDFSTLCSKRLLTQYVMEQLQLRENRPMSAEEQMAIRDMLNEYRKVEKGLQVACAMCYVEAARLKSPKQIQKWIDDPATAMRNYFADKNPEFAAYIKNAQGDFKESKGYDREAVKKDMKPKDRTELNKIRPKLRDQYKPSAEEQAIIDKAMSLPASTYLTAGNLANLSETDPAIYDAYTAFVRTATRSKSLETDEPYYYGDSTRDNGNGIVVTDSFIEAVNKENGMRFSSWSDWRIQHLLDYITAVIDNSVRGAAMHGYTKFPDEVRVLGKTGMMFNMSGVAGSQTGLNEDGSLSFSDTESIDVNEAIQLREEFPETAGLQCIGVGNDHIVALLRSDIIDYVIPYHVSGLNAALRRMADIHGWKDYTSVQHAAIDNSIKFEDAVDKEHWHEEPVFSEFFVGYDTGMTGIEAMKASGEKYKQMCKDRGLKPKFEQFASEENYWKLLVDRKMINQKTGNLIRQKAVTPTFDFGVIKSVVDKFVDNYDAGLEKRALNHIVENWDNIPQRIKDLKKQGGTQAKKTKNALKAMETVANQILAAQPKEEVKNSDRDYLDAVNRGDMETAQKMVDEAARAAGYTIRGNHGTTHLFTVFDRSKGNAEGDFGKGFYFTTNEDDVAVNYAASDGGDLTSKIEQLAENMEWMDGYEDMDYEERLSAARKMLDGGHNRTIKAVLRISNPVVVGGDNETFFDASEPYDEEADEYGEPTGLFFDLMDALRQELRAVEDRGGIVESNVEEIIGGITETFFDYGGMGAYRLTEIIKDDLGTSVYDEDGKLSSNEVLRSAFERMGFDAIEDHSVSRKWGTRSGRRFPMAGVNDDTTHYIVFASEQVKQADPVTYDDSGNVIPLSERFKTENDDIRYSERVNTEGMSAEAKKIISDLELRARFSRISKGEYASYSTERIEREIGRSSANKMDYAKSYIAWVNPMDFLYATTTSDAGRAQIEKEAGELDLERLRKQTQPIHLTVDFETGKIVGHEGRHRMIALHKAGVEKVAVIFDAWNDDRYNTKPVDMMRIGGQEFDKYHGGIDFYVHDMLPLSKRYADATRKLFSEIGGSVKFSERTNDDVSNRSLLANAFESITQSSAEYKLIHQYKGYIAELNSLEKKLSDFNQQIREIRFGKGKYDAEKLRKLEGEAKKIAKAISDYDKKLLWLEASGPLRKVIEQERKKEAQKTKDHVKEIQKNKKTRAEQTELRRKIRKAVRDLDKILKHGNKQKNVKEDIQPVVNKALKAADILFTDNYNTYDMLRNGIGADLSDAEEALVDTCAKMLRDLDKMPTEGYEAWQARQEAEDKLKAKMSKLKEVFARERKRLNNTTVSSILADLADSYKSLETSEQSYVQGAYMEPVYEFLKNLQSEVGGTIVSDMTKDQLESVYAAYQMVLTTVRKANTLFNQGIKMNREQLGNAVIEEVIKAGGTHGLWTKAEIARNQADWNNTKPIWVANRIGSESFSKLMQGLFQGQYNFAVDIEEAKQFKQEMDKKYNPKSWDAEKQYKFESSTGKEFSLNLQQIMSLYAFSKREQAYSHLLSGGFVFEGNSTVIVDEKGRKKTYIHNGAASYKLNEATLNGIINSLTKEQKAYVDEMQAYLSDVMGAKGNEVSMQLYGIQMFKEKYYFPLRSSGAYMERAKEAEMKKQQGQINLVNSGFTHAVKPQAKNPIILSGFMDVWAEHCNEMSMYHSMVLPMEDFRKVYNYTTVHDENFDSASVYQTIQDAYGKAAVDYIDQLYRELNAGTTVDPRETPFKTLISKFKKASVMMSASVVVQQFSSIGRAYAIIDPKHFTGKKIDSGTKLTAAEEMKKYAPVAIIKEMGGFDTGTKGSAKSYIMAETYGKGERLQGIKKDEQYRSDLMGYLPAKADEITWCAIWEAAKRETKANHPKMDVTSEEFLKLAGERFSEVVEKTQVYDSVLARSANMRSKSAFMQMATAFMAEPTTTINLLEDAIRSKDKKQLARAFGAVAVSIVLNNALASIVYAMRDDDEDETFIEKYFQSFTSGMIDDLNPMSYYPFLKDVYSLFQGYDVERSDMSVIADVRDALKKAAGLIGKDTSDMDDNELAEHRKNVTSALMSLLDAGCSMFGVPFKNVRRDANGIINAFKTAGKDLTERDTSWLSFWDKVGAAAKDTVPFLAWTKDKPKGDKLYDAIISGDQAYLDRLKGGYKSEDAYHSAVRKALRENDPRIQAAAKARYEGRTEEYKRIFREIQGEGKFGFDDIMSAINTELSKLTPDKETSQYSAKGFVEAVIMGNSNGAQTMRDDIISTHIANGKTREEAEEAFTSSVISGIKDAFSSGVLDERGAKNMLMDYAGKDKDDATSKVEYWAFCEKYPQHKDIFTEERLAKYNEYAKPAKISVDVYARFLSETKDLATVYDKWGDVEKTKREQVLEVIDSLPLTWRQKDALYLAAGYSENNILDVPW